MIFARRAAQSEMLSFTFNGSPAMSVVSQLEAVSRPGCRFSGSRTHILLCNSLIPAERARPNRLDAAIPCSSSETFSSQSSHVPSSIA